MDLSNLEYISSMGIRSLVKASSRTQELYHRVAVCGMRPEVRVVIENAKIDSFLDVYDSVSELPFAYDLHASRQS